MWFTEEAGNLSIKMKTSLKLKQMNVLYTLRKNFCKHQLISLNMYKTHYIQFPIIQNMDSNDQHIIKFSQSQYQKEDKFN